MGDYSSFLFARPSFVEGMSRIIDFGNTLAEYNFSTNPEEADARALAADWAAIGFDAKHIFGPGNMVDSGTSDAC